MKAIILTVALAGLVAMGNVNNASAVTKGKVYTNILTDSANNTKTTILSKGENGTNLKLDTKYVLKYNENGKLKEKTTYKWNQSKNQWEGMKKYIYAYGNNGELEVLAYSKWDKNAQSWSSDIQYAMYTYTADGKQLSIK